MKNLFKSKKIYAFLLTMIMCLSLFLFSACSEDDEKLLFKIVYRPYASSNSEFFGGTYKEKIKEDLDKTTEYVVNYVVGAFGIGEIRFQQENKDTGKLETIKLSPEFPNDNEYYYEDLLGINRGNTYYREVVSKIVQTNFIYYDYEKSTNIPAIMILSNHDRVNSRYIEENIALFTTIEEGSSEEAFMPQSSLQLVGTNQYFFNKPLEEGNIYFYEDDYGYCFVFVGGYVSGGGTYNSPTNANRFVTSLLSTNYNNIQQTVGKIEIYNGSGTGLTNSSSWEFSLTQNELNNINDAQDYLDTYMEKYADYYKIGIIKSILTRGGTELPEDLDRAFNLAIRKNLTAEQKKTYHNNFIDAACEYIDHLGLIPDDVESLTTFLTETIMGSNVTITDTLKQSCIKCLTSAQEALGYAPLLEVLSYKGSELEEVKIDGYIQSIIILRDDDSYIFSDLIALFALEENQTIDSPYLVTVRHQENGDVKEYPIAQSEELLADGGMEVSMQDILEDEEGLEISKSEDPIKAGLLSRKTSIVDDAKKYANMFTYSTSTENTDGFCWCFSNESSNFIQIVFATESLCVNQHLDIDVLIF